MSRLTIFKVIGFALFLPMLLRAEPVAENVAIEQALLQSWGQHFWIERHAGRYKMGDPASGFNDCNDVTNLSFDIGNNAMLANVGVQGQLKAVTDYRRTYRTVTSSWPGYGPAKTPAPMVRTRSHWRWMVRPTILTLLTGIFARVCWIT